MQYVIWFTINAFTYIHSDIDDRLCKLNYDFDGIQDETNDN